MGRFPAYYLFAILGISLIIVSLFIGVTGINSDLVGLLGNIGDILVIIAVAIAIYLRYVKK